jgi:hypothetical protein
MRQFTFLTTAGLIGSIIGTYLTKPTDQKVLNHFYRTTRPFGLWAPCKSMLPARDRDMMEKEHRNDLLAVPFGLCWMITMLMAPMQLMIGEYKSFAVTVGLLVIALGGLYIFWYRPLMKCEYQYSVDGHPEKNRKNPAESGMAAHVSE